MPTVHGRRRHNLKAKTWAGSIPAHGRRRHMRLPIMGRTAMLPSGCVHALSRHEDLVDPTTERKFTISYALPCQQSHKSKNQLHKDALGREWK